MADAIIVINAGSSSLKFSLFVVRGGDLALDVRGQIEGLDTAPRFVAKDSSGRTVAERSWGKGEKLDHNGAVEYLRGYLRGQLGDDRLIGVGHRVVHGGLEYTEPVLVDGELLQALERLPNDLELLLNEATHRAPIGEHGLVDGGVNISA
jgi:acetate kinase